MAIRFSRTSARSRGIAVCAGVLLSVLALSLIHATGPHYTAHCGCSVTLALESPALAAAPVFALEPVPAPPALRQGQEAIPRRTVERLPGPMRAPPARSICV